MDELKHLKQYKLLARLGSGSFGEVYKAEDEELERMVALKILKAGWLYDEEAPERFRREARAAAKLDHPHIITIYEIGQAEGRLFIAMQFVDGLSLHQLIRKKGSFPLQNVVSIIDQIASALDYSHNQSFIHRDVKSSNVLVDAGGNAYLSDFGLVQALEGAGVDWTEISLTGTRPGSLPYMAPEIITNPETAGPLSDQYSLGIVTYESIAGKLPFIGSDLEIQHAQLRAIPPSLSRIQSEVTPVTESVIFRSLAKNPQERFLNCKEFVDALQNSMGGVRIFETNQAQTQSPKFHTVTWPGEQRKLYRSRKNRVIAGVIGGFAEQWRVDPAVLRILVCIVTLILNCPIPGISLIIASLLYVILALAIPSEPKE